MDNDILLLLMLALFTGEYDDKHVKWEGGCKFCFVSESEAHENPRKDEKGTYLFALLRNFFSQFLADFDV